MQLVIQMEHVLSTIDKTFKNEIIIMPGIANNTQDNSNTFMEQSHISGSPSTAEIVYSGIDDDDNPNTVNTGEIYH